MTNMTSIQNINNLIKHYHNEQTKKEFNQLNDLNNRFVNFLNLVKSETKQSEYLQQCLNEKKLEFIQNSTQIYKKYHEDLLNTKNYLNELSLGLTSCLIRERNGRTTIEWYSKLIEFEQQNLKLNTNISNTNQQHKQFESSSPLSCFDNENNFYQNLSNLSTISTSQSSLASCSSSFSYPISLSSTSSSTSSTDISQPELNYSSSTCSNSNSNSNSNSSNHLTSSLSPIFHQLPQFSLDIYLNNLKQNRSQLNEEYEKKLHECEQLKQNVNKLTCNVNELNDKLDLVKTDNLSLTSKIGNLKKQINFYKQQQQQQKQESKSDINQTNNSNSWLNNELLNIKKELKDEFEKITYDNLEEYEANLKEEFLFELDKLQTEYDTESIQFENESNLMLKELEELNISLQNDYDEYKKLRDLNESLNTRLIELSSGLIEFNTYDREKQDKLVLNYSNKQLSRQCETIKNEIKNLRNDLNMTKNDLIKFDLIDLILKSKLNENLSQSNDHDIFLNKLFKKGRCYPFKLRPYYAQIETTKSNIFSYFIIKFDLIYQTYSNLTTSSNKFLKVTNNSSNNNSILNNLKINDSTDGHTITIENNHKILDIDLSEWKLKREIYYTNQTQNTEFNFDLTKLNFNCTTNEDSLVLNSCDDKSMELIEYKFPKGFKLKRRKKLSLIATGAQNNLVKSKSLFDCNLNDSGLSMDISNNKSNNNKMSKKKKVILNSSMGSLNNNYNNNNNKPVKLTQLKCACCACQMLIKRKEDGDFIEIGDISNWGNGLLVVTKLVNNKNVLKIANYKILKHIWVNDDKKKVD